MRASALLALLLLAGCGGEAPSDTALGECQRQAVEDPTVQAAIVDANTSLQGVRMQGVHDLAVARQAAVQRCLAAKGLAPKGGVEPVKGEWLGPPLL